MILIGKPVHHGPSALQKAGMFCSPQMLRLIIGGGMTTNARIPNLNLHDTIMLLRFHNCIHQFILVCDDSKAMIYRENM